MFYLSSFFVCDPDFPIAVSVANRVVIYRCRCDVAVDNSTTSHVILFVDETTRGLEPRGLDARDVQKKMWQVIKCKGVVN